jgi:glycosyltransferase involved in cell wall biosynthesis
MGTPPSGSSSASWREVTSIKPPPLVTVLLPCWNAERSIERALASVLEERSVPLECVVIDDGSTDGTSRLVEAVAARDDRVVHARLAQNGGVSNARNYGVAVARGEWLTMLDADDRFLPGGLAALIRAARTDRAIRAVVGQQVWSDGTRTWRTSLYDIPDIRRPGRTALASRPGLLYYVSPHAKLFHRSTFDGLRFSGRVLGDQAWIIRALLRAGDGVEVIAEDVYEWYRPAEGAGADSITITARASARRSAEAAEVAVDSFRAVAEEAVERLDDAGRDAILSTYAGRLLRSDLGVVLAKAIARRDPETGELVGAIHAFLRSVPPKYLEATEALARDIVEPPVRGWGRLDAPAKSAFRQLVENLAPAVRASARRRPPIARLGIAAGLPGRSSARGAIASALLTTQWLVEGAARRARRQIAR